MTTAWIDGQPVSSGEAIREAANLLANARLPLVTGRIDDVSALREAARLAGYAGGVLDHEGMAEVAPLIEALRDNGIIRIASGEARRRASRVLVIGEDPFAAAPEIFDQIFSVAPDLGSAPTSVAKDAGREIVLLGPDTPGRFSGAKGHVRTISCPTEELGDAIGILRAALGEQPFNDGPFQEGAARALAGWLKDAGFAAIIFDAAQFDAIDIEMIAGLVADLNAETRASALPLCPSGAFGAAEAALWATGFPLRTAFGRGDPEHDMVLNESARLLASGESDARLILATSDTAPDAATAPTILLSPSEKPGDDGVRVTFKVGRPGIDHTMVHHEPRFGGVVETKAGASGMAPNAADILSAIADQLARQGQKNEEASS